MSGQAVARRDELSLVPLARSREALACLRGREPVGWSTLCRLDPGDAYDRTRQLSVRVVSPCRREGIGEWLVGRSLEHAGEQGLQTIVALSPSEPGWIRAWLGRHGFEQVGRLPGGRSGHGLSVLQLTLGGRR